MSWPVIAHGNWFPGYTPYLRKRFLVISAEDCFGVITKEIVALSEIGDEKALTQALALMCAAKRTGTQITSSAI